MFTKCLLMIKSLPLISFPQTNSFQFSHADKFIFMKTRYMAFYLNKDNKQCYEKLAK